VPRNIATENYVIQNTDTCMKTW